MGYNTVRTDVQTVGAGLTVDVRPPDAFHSWRITEIGSDQRVGVLPNAVPDVDVGIFDGVREAFVLRSVDVRGWYRKQNIVIDRDNYCRLTNNNAAAANLSWSGELIRYHGVAPTVVRTDVQTVGTGLTIDVRPATATEDWIVRDIGSSNWLGAAPNGVPNVEVDYNDGIIVARVMDSTETRQWEAEQRLYVNRTHYLTLTNAGLANADVGWSAELLRYYGNGASIVRSEVRAVGAGLNVDIIPPVGEEWEVTIFGSSLWIGISPAQFPDITVSIFDAAAAIGSPIEDPTSWHGNGHEMKVHVDAGDHLRINDGSGVGQNVAISAVLSQRYA